MAVLKSSAKLKIGGLLHLLVLLGALFLQLQANASEISRAQEKGLLTIFENDFQLCVKARESCISGDVALQDLYGVQNITTLTSIGLVGNKYVAQVKAAIRFQGGKDLYAIFIVQKNEISERSGVEKCRACLIKLGMVIYQYNNKWKLFAANSELAATGEWGELGMIHKTLKIYPLASERFVIMFNEASIAQGYETTITNVFQVNTNSLDRMSTAAQVDINFLGSIVTAESSCGARADGESWTSDLIMSRSNSIFPYLQLRKSFADCDGRPLRRAALASYRYNNIKKRYQEH